MSTCDRLVLNALGFWLSIYAQHFPGIVPLSSKVFADVSFGDAMVRLMQIIYKSTPRELLQPLLVSLNYLGHFSILARVTSANPSHSTKYEWLAPNTLDLQAHKCVNNPPTLAFGTLPLISSQWLDVDFHPWKSTLWLIIALPEKYYNNPNHIRQLCPHVNSMPVKAMPFGLRWVRLATPPHPCKPLGFWAGPLPTIKKPFVSAELPLSFTKPYSLSFDIHYPDPIIIQK
jgi:hypothetical protein